MEYLTSKQKKKYITILAVVFYLITIASQAAYIMSDVTYIDSIPGYYIRAICLIIASILLFSMMKKWHDSDKYKLGVRYLALILISILASNLGDHIVHSVQYRFVFYQTFFQILRSFFFALIASFTALLFIYYIIRKMPKYYAIHSFYVPIIIKYSIIVYALVVIVMIIHMGTNIFLVERRYVERFAYQNRVDVSSMRSDINQYISSLSSMAKYDANMVADIIYRSGNAIVDRPFFSTSIFNNLNLLDEDAKKPFSRLSIYLLDEYTYEQDLSAVMFINEDATFRYEFFNEPDILNINEYTELGKGSGVYVKLINTRNNTVYISVVSEIKYADRTYGYIELYVPPNHLKNIISSYVSYYSSYCLVDTKDDIVLTSNDEENYGRIFSSVYSYINGWDRFLEEFKNVKSLGADIFFHNGNDDARAKTDDYYIYGTYINSLDIAFVEVVMGQTFFIANQINKTVLFQFYVTLAAFLLLIGIFTLFMMGTTRPLWKAIKYTNTLKDGMGDLTKRVKIINNDETGLIIYNYNAFFDYLVENMSNFRRENAVLNKDSKDIIEMLSSSSSVIQEQMSSIGSTVNSLSSVLGSISKIGDSTQQQKYAFSSANIAIEELLKMILTINENMEKQSTAVAQTSASIEEMISNISSVAKSVDNADKYAKKLLEEARSGEDIVDNVIDAIREIEENSDQIKEIITVIQGIAEQTNLLAMNAAIEAAHAGEQGKGFAVVADEIRSLAEHTADNTKSITTIIKEITKRVTNTVDLALGSGHSLESILTTSDRTARVISEINLANSEIEIGGKEILDSVHNLNTITQVVKDSIEEQIQNGNIVESQIVLLDKITQEVSNSIIRNTSNSNDINENLVFLTNLSDKINEKNKSLYTGINRINESFEKLGSFMNNFICEHSISDAADEDSDKPKKKKRSRSNFEIENEEETSQIENELKEILADLRESARDMNSSNIAQTNEDILAITNEDNSEKESDNKIE